MILITVRRYLKDRPTYPALDLAQAHFFVALSCSLYLFASLDLVDASITQEDTRLEIKLGLHELQFYANDHFLEHLQMLSQHNSSSLVSKEDLTALQQSLDRLARRHDTLEPWEQHSAQ